MSERSEEQAYIFGIDCQQFIQSYNDLLSFIKTHDPVYHLYIIRLLAFLREFKSERDYANAVVKGKLKKYINILPDVLQDLLSNYQWDKVEEYLKLSEENNIDPIDIISSEQNVEILVNAEEYFRKMEEKESIKFTKKGDKIIAFGGGTFLNKQISNQTECS